VPAQVRVIVSSALAVFACAWLPLPAPPPLLSAAGLLSVSGEVLVGLALGFVLQLGFTAPVIAAETIGGVMGMSIATGIDPASGAQSPALGQYFRVVLTLVFFALGAHLAWIELLIDSYRVVPARPDMARPRATVDDRGLRRRDVRRGGGDGTACGDGAAAGAGRHRRARAGPRPRSTCSRSAFPRACSPESPR